MHSKNIVNLVLICLGVFVTGVSLTLLAPFYPSEALKKVDSYKIYLHEIFYYEPTVTGVEGSLCYTVRGCDEHSVYCHHCLHSSVREGRCISCNIS